MRMMSAIAALARHCGRAVIVAIGLMGAQMAAAQIQGCASCAKAAVLDMDSTQQCEYFAGQWGRVFSCTDGWRAFQANLETAITQTRKLQVVERNQLYRMMDEQAVQSFFRSAGRKWSFTTTGADYLVYGNITEVGYQAREYNDRMSSNRNVVGTFAVDVKFAETRTGKIFYAGTVRVEETMAGGSASASSSSSTTTSLGALYGALQRKAARAIALQLVTQAYPIRILRVTGDSAILSYGGGVLERGMILDVTDGSGGDLVDPDTGRVIRGAGITAATLVVTSANPDFAVAKLRTGSPSALNAAARVLLSEEVPEAGRPMTGGEWADP